MLDLRKWIPFGGLKDLCKSFSVPDKYRKLDFDHDAVQLQYEECYDAGDINKFISIIAQNDSRSGWA